MKFKGFLTILLIAGLTLLSGCGDIFKKKVIRPPLESTKFSANCKLDIDKFSQIMFENISGTINCLGENLKLFIRVVESDKADYLSRTALVSFIENNRTDIGRDALKALKAVFDINFLIFGENPNYISKNNVEKIIDFAILFNEKAALNFRIFQDSDTIEHNEYVVLRNRINDNSLLLTNSLSQIFNRNRNGETHSLNIVSLLESFTTENNRDSMEDIKKFLFVKKMVVGGLKNVITHKELDLLIQNFNNLSTITLDITRFKYVKLDSEQILEFLAKPLDSLRKVLFVSQVRDPEEHFFDMQDAIDAFKLLMPTSTFDVDKFKNLINEGKQILVGGNQKQVKAGEFKKLLEHCDDVLFNGITFYQIYNNFRGQLDSTRPLTIDFTLYRHNYPGRRIGPLEEFSRIIKNYRFFKGEALSATYTTTYSRNPSAIFEIYVYEYILKLVFNHKTIERGVTVPWASPSNGLGGKSMNKNEVLALIKRFEKELIELDIILPNRASSTAESVTLLGSLFQYQSNDNNVLDVNEAAEFAISLFTSVNVSSDIMKYYKTKSGCEFDQYNRIEPDCFKANFFKALCAKNYRKYYPKLFESLGAANSLNCEVVMNPPNLEFLNTSIRAARTCPIYPDDGKEIFYSEGDMLTIFLAMMHVETTILKWDVRGTPNNIMDPKEVMDAYPTYSPALDVFLEDMPSFVKALKRQIFQFMIKYEQIPSKDNIGKFLRFLLGNKQASANRKTIAAILATISEESAKKTPEADKFDCNSLHDPTDLNRTGTLSKGTAALPVQSDFWTNIQTHENYRIFMSNPVYLLD